MPRCTSHFLSACSLASLLLTSVSLQAQTTDSEKNDPPPVQRRAVSTGVAAALTASMPKYNPPKPEEKKPVDDRDMRDVDKPRNKIIRLPDYVVRQDKPPVFRERDIYTNSGLAELAKNRYLSESVRGLNRYTIPLFGVGAEAYAMALYRQDERLENMSDLKESADDISKVNPENAKEIRKATTDTYNRGFDSRYRTGD